VFFRNVPSGTRKSYEVRGKSEDKNNNFLCGECCGERCPLSAYLSDSSELVNPWGQPKHLKPELPRTSRCGGSQGMRR
jgi:hypothetical protein